MEVRFSEKKKRKISKKAFLIENLGGEMIQMET